MSDLPKFGGEIFPDCPPLARINVTEEAAARVLDTIESYPDQAGDPYNALSKLGRLSLGVDPDEPMNADEIAVAAPDDAEGCTECGGECKIAIIANAAFELAANDSPEEPGWPYGSEQDI